MNSSSPITMNRTSKSNAAFYLALAARCRNCKEKPELIRDSKDKKHPWKLYHREHTACPTHFHLTVYSRRAGDAVVRWNTFVKAGQLPHLGRLSDDEVAKFMDLVVAQPTLLRATSVEGVIGKPVKKSKIVEASTETLLSMMSGGRLPKRKPNQ